MKPLPISIPHTVAGHYHRDAWDFAKRFDKLWEDQLHKTGRIKSFVDLVMGCECALKSHVFLSRLDRDPAETYRKIRAAGHSIARLSALAEFMRDRDIYDSIASELGGFSVFIRYSLDAYAAFFPALVDRADAPFNYSSTIGNNSWVLHMRHQLELLIEAASPEFTGEVDGDLLAIIEHEEHMEAFMQSISPRGAIRQASPANADDESLQDPDQEGDMEGWQRVFKGDVDGRSVLLREGLINRSFERPGPPLKIEAV